MTDNPILHIFDSDASAGCRNEDAATEPSPSPEIDVAALRRRADTRSAEEVAQIVEEIDRVTFAQDVLDLAREYLGLADLDSAGRWFDVAAAYGAADAETESANVRALRDAMASIPATDTEGAVVAHRPRGNSGVPAVAQVRLIIGNAVGVLEEARRMAERTVDDAEREAKRISSAAEIRALLGMTCLGGGSAIAVKGESSAALWGLMDRLSPVAHRDIAEEATTDALLRVWNSWACRFSGAGATGGSTTSPGGCSSSATREAVDQWMRIGGDSAGGHLFGEAGRRDRHGDEAQKASRNHPSDVPMSPMTLPPVLPSSPRSTDSPRLFDPPWFSSGVSHLPPVRERITPGPRLRKALNKLSMPSPSSDVPLEAAG